MSDATKEQVIQAVVDGANERTQWSKWYRRNACAVHGVEPDATTSGVKIESKSTVSTPAPASTGTSSQATGGMPTWQKIAVAALLAGSGAGATYFLTRPTDEPPPPPAATTGPSSLYQDLEDQGLHLPR